MTIHILDDAAPQNLAPPYAFAQRSVPEAMLRGAAMHCPACGQGKIYHGFLKVAATCPSCHEELHHQRADDAPPYFTMFIVGHIIVAAVMVVEKVYAPELWVHGMIWTPLILALSLLLLPRIKGALIGLQWALRMHGFGGVAPSDDVVAEPTATNR